MDTLNDLFSHYSCIKATLLPHLPSASAWTFCTRAIAVGNGTNNSNEGGSSDSSSSSKPTTFGETFPLAVPRSKLASKTLQVTIWALSGDAAGSEDCLGSAQVSLADFDVESVSVRWYNVLSFHFMQQPGEQCELNG